MAIKSIPDNIAIVHDTLVEAGGAEQVVATLLKLFPSADLYTSLIKKGTPQLQQIENRVKKSWKGIPFLDNYRTISKLLVHLYWESIDLSKYKLVISSADVFSAKSIITRPETLHICYCHTPPKFLYPEYPGVRQDTKSLPLRTNILLSVLRYYDYLSAQRPDIFIANSKTVQRRVKKYYRRDSTVIYPPVALPKKKPETKKIDGHYLYIGKLQKSKGVEIAIKACEKLKKKLVVIGDGEDKKYLAKLKGPNITLTGFIAEKEKNNYLKHAKAFIFPAIDEDFGIAPVEAMAHGVPVIAFYSGGVKESVVQGKTGIFFRENTPQALAKAIKKFETLNFNPLDCYKQATKFSQERFEREIVRFIKQRI